MVDEQKFETYAQWVSAVKEAHSLGGRIEGGTVIFSDPPREIFKAVLNGKVVSTWIAPPQRNSSYSWGEDERTSSLM